MANRTVVAISVAVVAMLGACGGGGPMGDDVGDDVGDDAPPDVDLATCVTWRATAPAALTASDGEQ